MNQLFDVLCMISCGYGKGGKFGSKEILGAERLQVFGKVFRGDKVVMLLSKSAGMVIT